MIISVEKLRQYITADFDDQVLEAKLQALESLIRKYTNNNFQNRNVRFVCDAQSGILINADATYLKVGDTIQISQSKHNDGIYVVKTIDGNEITLDKDVFFESKLLVTKVEYPMDVQIGVVNMMKWDIESRDKVGIQSEAISRHSVTYFNMDGDNSLIGYPKSLIGFLKPYMKARF